MSQLVNGNEQVEEQHHFQRDENVSQNCHVKIRPLRRDALNISGKTSPAITERREPLPVVFSKAGRIQWVF
jgi:hypothetical protein